MYWLSYDDIADHARLKMDPDSINLYFPLVLQQKLLISFAGSDTLQRLSADATFKSNFSAVTCFAAQDTAGIMKERKLVRYRKLDANTASLPNLFVLREPYLAEDNYGQGGTLKCPTYGKATFFVANTTRDAGLNSSATSRYPGLIFLDYIRLVPKVDVND
jgi:hypothetical protein